MSTEPIQREPPPDLPARPLPLVALAGPWFRAYRLANDPLYFGRRATERFDDPAKGYGVCYVGDSVTCAFIETLPAIVDLPGRAVLGVYRTALHERGWARVDLGNVGAPLRLVDLTGPGLARLTADADLCSCPAYAMPQRWSRALHEHPESPDGLLYWARHDPSLLSLALFDDRVAGRIAMVPQGSWAEQPNLATLRDIRRRYGLRILPG